MEESNDRMEDEETAVVSPDTAANGACEAGGREGEGRQATNQTAASDPDTEMDTNEPCVVEGISVDTTPPESSTGVTAYFLFAGVHRERVKAALQENLPESTKVTIGMVGKKIGELWKQCADEVKQAYSEKAKANKEQAKKDTAAGGENGDDEHKKTASMNLPKTVVKKIVMLDEDQTRITADALELLTKASEMFLSILATKAHDEAKGAARSTVNFRDVDSVLRRWRPTAWQSSPFSEIEKATQASVVQNKGMAEAAQKTRSITSFFQQAT